MSKLTKEQIELVHAATARAKAILKQGDKIRASRGCSDRMSTYVFDHWDGMWAVSKSGFRDIAATRIDRLNGKPVDFKTA